MEKLSQYRWPGNLAEMEGVIKRAVVLTDPDSDQIPENYFDFLFLGSPLPGGPEYQKAIQILARRILQGEGSIREIESHMMETLVILSGGSIARAVERSGIPKDRFYRYFKKKGSLNP
jgi:DNA-binding NtrC family response regulator